MIVLELNSKKAFLRQTAGGRSFFAAAECDCVNRIVRLSVLTDIRDAIMRKKGVFSSTRTQEPLCAEKKPNNMVLASNNVC